MQGANGIFAGFKFSTLGIGSACLGLGRSRSSFDIAVHVGTLGAVLLYFRQHLFALARGCLRSGPEQTEVFYLAVATVPAVLAGFLLNEWLASWTRAPVVIMGTTLIFGCWVMRIVNLRWAFKSHSKSRWSSVCFRSLPWIPGTFRSGITITAALLLGVSRVEAARFSFLLSIPIIAGASLLLVKDAVELG